MPIKGRTLYVQIRRYIPPTATRQRRVEVVKGRTIRLVDYDPDEVYRICVQALYADAKAKSEARARRTSQHVKGKP